MCKDLHWVQFWAFNNFTTSSPCSQVCKRCCLCQQELAQTAFLPHTVQFTLLSVIILHKLSSSPILFALSIKLLMRCYEVGPLSADPWPPLQSHMLPAPLWITLGLFCCSYWLLSPLTYHGISAHRTIKHTVFCSFNHGNFDYFRPQLFIICIDHGHSKLIMCF